MGLIRLCIKVVIAISVIIFAYMFHLYYLAWVYSDQPYGNFAGIIIHLGFLADMSFFLLNVFQIILIILIIIDEFCRR